MLMVFHASLQDSSMHSQTVQPHDEPPHPAHAGRVQSVALRLIAEHEAEREAFKPDEWWTVDPLLTNADGKPFRVCQKCLSQCCCLRGSVCATPLSCSL